MKLSFFIILILFSLSGMAQDTTKANQKRTEYDTILVPKQSQNSSKRPKTKITFRNKKENNYRPTRLGSSSPRYDTYEKNKEGAGAVTTNTKKIQASDEPSPADSLIQKRDSTIRATDSTKVKTKSRKTKQNSGK